MARAQQQNRKLWFFGCFDFVWKGITAIFGMSTYLVTVQTMVYYFDKNYLSLVSTYALMVFWKKLKMARCNPNPRRPKIGIWTHLNMLYLNPTGSFKFCNFLIVYGPLTCWITECTSCRTEVFKFFHQRILTQHLANYCCVVSIHGLIVITSYRTSKLDLDKNQSVTDFDHSKQEISIINTKRILFLQRLFKLGFI